MILIYPPSIPPTRIGEPPADRCISMVLLHRRFWLHVRWEGLNAIPRITEATIKLSGYARPFPIERLSIVDKATFHAWYDSHWQRFNHTD